jgi:hypothetical protein
MGTIGLKEIRRIAEQESARHHHYYIGVEHLFVALTKLNNGLSNAVLEYCGLEPRFLRYSICQAIGVSEDRRYWPGFKETPRALKVMELAARYAGIHNPTERDLFLAILDENDSIPVRILQEVGGDLALLRTTAANWSSRFQAEVPKVPIQSTVPLTSDEQVVLRRLFRANDRILIERELGGSYGRARLLVVQPYRAQRAEARVVAKIDEQSTILREKRHYDSYVKDTLPPTTARILDNPALPENSFLGGLKYTLVQPGGGTNPVDLRNYAAQLSGVELSSIIRAGIFEAYHETWWSQRQRYRFGVWREYEHVLPAAIEAVVVTNAKPGSASQILEPLGSWSRANGPVKGELVELRGFTVQKVRDGSVQLAAGSGPEAVNRSSKIEVTGLGELKQKYRPGDVIESLVVRVGRTRDLILRAQVEALQPSFDLRHPTIATPPGLPVLPNPLFHIERLLDRRLSGYLSIIHGDLHLGNILVGPGGDAWLIDFGLTREGHTLFDWAVLEASLLSSVIAPRMPGGWDGVWGTIQLLNAVNNHQLRSYRYDNPVTEAFEAIRTLREIVQENLARSAEWLEYYVALTLTALRGLSWEKSTTLDVRRLLFLTAALGIYATNQSEQSQGLVSDMTRESLTTQELRHLSSYDLSTPASDERFLD